MEITLKNIKDIKPYEKNPRKNDGAVDYVANSIKEFGFKVPIVIDKDGIIVAGHTRFKAAKKLGLSEVPCIIADDLTEGQIKAYRLADNKVAEKAEWDFNILDEELFSIEDFDMSDFGFEIEKFDPDEFGTDFELASGDKSDIEQITFTLHREQAELIRDCIKSVEGVTDDYYGNINHNGNALWEIVRQWEEQKR